VLAPLSCSLSRSLAVSLRVHLAASAPLSRARQVGDDIPGSELALTVQKGGKAGAVRIVKLQRIATERIADRRRMFELFTLIKDRASQLQVGDTVLAKYRNINQSG
jgi:hypothetical protein